MRNYWKDYKVRATQLASAAQKRGELLPQPCESCGTDQNLHKHHDDYSRPLDVRWLCGACHIRHHAAERRKHKAEFTAKFRGVMQDIKDGVRRKRLAKKKQL